MHLYTSTYTHSDTVTQIQAHSCLSELHAGQCPTVIKTRLLWRQTPRKHMHDLSPIRTRTHVDTYLCFKLNCLFPLYSLSPHMVHRLIRKVSSLLLVYKRNKPIGRQESQTELQTDEKNTDKHVCMAADMKWVIQYNINQVKDRRKTGGNSAV